MLKMKDFEDSTNLFFVLELSAKKIFTVIILQATYVLEVGMWCMSKFDIQVKRIYKQNEIDLFMESW